MNSTNKASAWQWDHHYRLSYIQYIQHFEWTTIVSTEHKPSSRLKYVDDVFSVWPHGDIELEKFLKHLNTKTPSITFTIEKENKGKLPFLDILIDRNKDIITTLVYRKLPI